MGHYQVYYTLSLHWFVVVKPICRTSRVVTADSSVQDVDTIWWQEGQIWLEKRGQLRGCWWRGLCSRPALLVQMARQGHARFCRINVFPSLWCCDLYYLGTAARIVARKVAVDAVVFAVPYYTAFYVCLNYLSKVPIEESLAELRKKLVPTILSTTAFWVPAQTINFRFISPKYRVIYLAGCTFVEFNILAIFKRLKLWYILRCIMFVLRLL